MPHAEPPQNPVVVHTIGHGADDFGAFERRCATNGITTIVDVRSEPYSRHATDFVKERLEQLCAESGLGYRWLGNHLGGRPTDPALRDGSGHPTVKQ